MRLRVDVLRLRLLLEGSGLERWWFTLCYHFLILSYGYGL
jgi:hypothetical protein